MQGLNFYIFAFCGLCAITGAFKLPPRPKDHAVEARRLVHKSNWAPFGTMSTEPKLQGFSMVNVKSIADSARGEPSTGNIYLYLTDLDFSGKDVKNSNKVTLLFSDDTDLKCSKDSVDPMDPTCSRAIIAGSVVELEKESDEYKVARHAFHDRHPAADLWVMAHTFKLYKVEIENIIVLDWYGGANFVTSADYYKAKFENE